MVKNYEIRAKLIELEDYYENDNYLYLETYIDSMEFNSLETYYKLVLDAMNKEDNSAIRREFIVSVNMLKNEKEYNNLLRDNGQIIDESVDREILDGIITTLTKDWNKEEIYSSNYRIITRNGFLLTLVSASDYDKYKDQFRSPILKKYGKLSEDREVDRFFISVKEIKGEN